MNTIKTWYNSEKLKFYTNIVEEYSIQGNENQ